MKPSGVLASVVSCLVCTGFVSAATWYVDVNGSDANDGGSADAPFATIQRAIDSAGNGDSIEVWPGTHRGMGDSVAHIEDKSLTLYARDGMEVTFIDGENVRRGLLCEPLVVVDDVGIKIGGPDQGFTVQNCLGVEFRPELPGDSCYSPECGGGLFVHTDQGQADALVKVEWCLFQNNRAAWGGGAAFYDSTAALTSCTFRSNTASGECDGFGGGVGIGQESNVELHFCDFIENQATYGGGVSQRDSVHGSGTPLFTCSQPFEYAEAVCLAECDLVDDWSNDDEVCQCPEGQPHCYFHMYGGAYFNGCTFVNNTAETAGGGMNCSDILEVPHARTYLSGCVFTGNEAGQQGGGLNGPVGHLVMEACHFNSNQACICNGQIVSGVGGGAVMLWGTDYARMTDCSFIDNGTYASGGAIYSKGTLRLAGTRFEGNWAQGGALDAEGGAIYAEPEGGNSWLDLDHCAFTDNVAGRSGGAICTQKPSDDMFLASDCQFVRNRASYDSCQSCLECMGCDGVVPDACNDDAVDCLAAVCTGGLPNMGRDEAKNAEGGAIYHGGFAMTLERCCFLENDATSNRYSIGMLPGFNDGNARGGAIARPMNPHQLEIRNCVFAENAVTAWCDYDDPDIHGCGEALGGAIRDFPSNLQSNLVIAGTLFCQNTEPVISAANGYTDEGGNEFDEECPVLSCEGDFTCDGRVDVEDILAVLNGWSNPYDVNDVLNVIANWGCAVDGSTACACADGT